MTIDDGGSAELGRLSDVSLHDHTVAEVPLFARLTCGSCGVTADVEVQTWNYHAVPFKLINDLFLKMADGQAEGAKGWKIWDGKWRCGRHQVALVDRPGPPVADATGVP